MSRAETIAKLNDQLRARVGLPVFLGSNEQQLGTILMTSGIMGLSPKQLIEVWHKVRGFNTFSEDNNPHGERDFGRVDLSSGQRIFWKIDYYVDDTCIYGAEDPSDPSQSYRVLTIMLVEEY